MRGPKTEKLYLHYNKKTPVLTGVLELQKAYLAALLAAFAKRDFLRAAVFQ